MLMSGQDAWAMPADQLAAIGANFWSGDLLGSRPSQQPDGSNHVLNGNPMQPTGSFVSLSHAIKRNGALKRNDCHSPAGVLDYRVLGYTPEQATYWQTLLSKVQFISTQKTPAGLALRWSAIPGRTYQMLATDNLSGGTWWPLTPPARGISQWYDTVVPSSVLNTEPQIFFRSARLTLDLKQAHLPRVAGWQAGNPRFLGAKQFFGRKQACVTRPGKPRLEARKPKQLRMPKAEATVGPRAKWHQPGPTSRHRASRARQGRRRGHDLWV